MKTLLLLSLQGVFSFAPISYRRIGKATNRLGGAKSTTFLGARLSESEAASFDPLNLASEESWRSPTRNRHHQVAVLPATALSVLALTPENALAEAAASVYASPDMNPQNFQPVCPASDGFYRLLQGSTEAVVGRENFVEYGPLIAGGLLRVRLELCVIESFFNEAVGPFIKQNGLSWILPLHETVETFLAGTIFALASTFILVGSTKLVSVIVTYADVFLGVPFRVLGGFAFDRARGKPVTLDLGFGPFKTRVIGPPDNTEEGGGDAGGPLIDFENTSPVNLVIVLTSGVVKYIGEGLKVKRHHNGIVDSFRATSLDLLSVTKQLGREVIEAADLFVGRYLVLIATGYIGLKFVHFKVFPDFPF